jgi:hypothetical protein
MTVLVAAVVLVGALAVLNLLLTLAVVRRLKDAESRRTPQPDSGPPVGTAIPEFDADTLDGDRITHDLMGTGRQVFAFYSTTCSACVLSVPHLVDYIRHHDLPPECVVVFVNGAAEHAGPFTGPLTGLASIVVESVQGSVTSAFSVNAYPTIVISEDGTMVSRREIGSRPLLPAEVPA